MRSPALKRILDRTPKDVKIFVRLYADLVVRINTIMREQGLSQNQLASRMDKKPSEISKWLKGNHNLTLRSIAKLQAELGEALIEIPETKAPAYFKGEEVMSYRALKRNSEASFFPMVFSKTFTKVSSSQENSPSDPLAA
jgi:transcriptional regulator with XRE-family HTH domain